MRSLVDAIADAVRLAVALGLYLWWEPVAQKVLPIPVLAQVVTVAIAAAATILLWALAFPLSSVVINVDDHATRARYAGPVLEVTCEANKLTVAWVEFKITHRSYGWLGRVVARGAVRGGAHLYVSAKDLRMHVEGGSGVEYGDGFRTDLSDIPATGDWAWSSVTLESHDLPSELTREITTRLTFDSRRYAWILGFLVRPAPVVNRVHLVRTDLAISD